MRGNANGGLRKRPNPLKAFWGVLIIASALSLATGEALGCYACNVKLYVGETEGDAEEEDYKGLNVALGITEYWVRVEWQAIQDGPEENNDFNVYIWDEGSPDQLVAEKLGVEDNEYVMTEVFRVTNSLWAHALDAGRHNIYARVERIGTSQWPHANNSSNCATVAIVTVDKVVRNISPHTDEGPLYVRPGSSVGLRALPNVGYFPDGWPDWEVVSKPTGAFVTVNPAEDSETTILSGLSEVGPYVISATCGTGGDNIEVVAVGVGRIEMYAGSPRAWHDVTSSTVTVLKGSQYDFKAYPDPSGALWPPTCPDWYRDGYIQLWGDTYDDVDFPSTESVTLLCKCGDYDPGKAVTITPIVPDVDSVKYMGGNHVLYEANPPEYRRSPSQNNPGCWTKGARAQAEVKFWYSQNLTFAEPGVVVWGETFGDMWNIADWGYSAPATFGAGWPTAGITCVAEGTINSSVQFRVYSAHWCYKCTNGMNTAVCADIQSDCILYVVLDTPKAPQAQPWK
ncbi:MAG: hypothetical protein ACYTBJ_25350, partial [Planctomycetota bacterium]